MSSTKRPSSRNSVLSDSSRGSSSTRTTSIGYRDTLNWGSIDATGTQRISTNFASAANANAVKFNDLELYGNEHMPESAMVGGATKDKELEIISENNRLKKMVRCICVCHILTTILVFVLIGLTAAIAYSANKKSNELSDTKADQIQVNEIKIINEKIFEPVNKDIADLKTNHIDLENKFNRLYTANYLKLDKMEQKTREIEALSDWRYSETAQRFNEGKMELETKYTNTESKLKSFENIVSDGQQLNEMRLEAAKTDLQAEIKKEKDSINPKIDQIYKHLNEIKNEIATYH